MSTDSAQIIAENVSRIRDEISRAAADAGRSATEIRLVGVTKSVGTAAAAALFRAGVRDLAENRPEALVDKSGDPALAGADWHLIGTFQRRKIRDSLARMSWVHSIHSVDLGLAVATRARELGRTIDCLIQVNISGEAAKQGFSSAEAPAALATLADLPGIRVQGLMTMAPENAPPPELRRIFAATRALRDRLRSVNLPLSELSMGMSSDFREAILEGATMVRIGSALFRGIPSVVPVK